MSDSDHDKQRNLRSKSVRKELNKRGRLAARRTLHLALTIFDRDTADVARIKADGHQARVLADSIAPLYRYDVEPLRPMRGSTEYRRQKAETFQEVESRAYAHRERTVVLTVRPVPLPV